MRTGNLSDTTINGKIGKKRHTSRFHAYESALVYCDFYDGISIWRILTFKTEGIKNGNRDGNRITSMKWVNERIKIASFLQRLVMIAQ